MPKPSSGTNFFPSNGPIRISLTDENGNAMFGECLAADVPAGASNYAVGCELVATDSGVHYYNVGTILVASWVAANTGAGSSLTDAHIFVGNAGNAATDVAVSGDLTLANTGAFTIANDAVTTAKILNANVTLAKLAAGITPSHIVKFAGQPTTAGGAAAEVITVTGALNTDLAFVQMVDNGTNNTTIVSAVVTADTLTVTFSADPGADAVINYQLLRAAA